MIEKELLEKYDIQENKLIRGGQADIFFGVQKQHDKKDSERKRVVIKKYFNSKSEARDLEVMEKIRDSKCESLVKLIEVVSTQSGKYIVMEFCNNGDLYSYMVSRKKPVQNDEEVLKVLDIAIQIVDGMITLCEVNIAHRDLKPENILIHVPEQQGNISPSKNKQLNQNEKVQKRKKIIVKITDYGLCKNNDRLISLVGTPNYMAPEILKNITGKQQKYQSSVDVFSFGLILFEMLTAKQFFVGKSQNDIFNKIKSFDALNYSDPTTDKYKDLQYIIIQCLQQQPEKRPSFQQIKQQLQQQIFYLEQKLSFKNVNNEESSSFDDEYDIVQLPYDPLQEKPNDNMEESKVIEGYQEFYYPNQLKCQMYEPQNQKQENLKQPSKKQRSKMIKIVNVQKLQSQPENKIKELGYSEEIKKIDSDKFMGIATANKIILSIAPLILHYLIKNNIEHEIEELKNIKIQGSQRLDTLYDFLSGFRKEGKQIKKFLIHQTILNIFSTNESISDICMIIEKYIKKQVTNNLDFDQLIVNNEDVDLPCKLKLSFTNDDYSKLLIDPNIFQIFITPIQFKNNQTYSILLPKQSYNQLFQII